MKVAWSCGNQRVRIRGVRVWLVWHRWMVRRNSSMLQILVPESERMASEDVLYSRFLLADAYVKRKQSSNHL